MSDLVSSAELADPVLSAPVGRGCFNNPRDILWVRAALAVLGRHGPQNMISVILNPDLDEAIRSYQRDRGLCQDGRLAPDDETERSLRFDLVCQSC